MAALSTADLRDRARNRASSLRYFFHVTNGTITLPLYQGTMKNGRTPVWYILTDVDDAQVLAVAHPHSPPRTGGNHHVGRPVSELHDTHSTRCDNGHRRRRAGTG